MIYECDYEPMVKELLDYYSEQVSIYIYIYIYINIVYYI